MQPSEGAIQRVRKLYQDAYQKYGNSVKSIMSPKGRQDMRFDALTAPIKHDNFSLLDYGCGLGHLKAYLERRFTNFSYHGVEIVGEFIQEDMRNFRTGTFTEIKSYTDISNAYDYVVLCGVFSLLYSDDLREHQSMVQDTLLYLFQKTKIALSVDFMTDKVDYKQENAYHQNVVEIYNFISQKMSPRLVLDQSYMPFEYTFIVYKNQKIIRPDNVYESVTHGNR